MDHCQNADLVEIRRLRVPDVGVLERNQSHHAVLRQCIIDELNGTGALYDQRENIGRKDDRIPERKDGNGLQLTDSLLVLVVL